MKINKILPLKHKYLQITACIAKQPKLLYYIGKLPETRIPSLAVIGTRKPTTYGREVTERLTYALAERGIVIVSGLALGVDALAHRAALDAHGTTIAILPCGLPKIAPATNKDLAEAIIKGGGALISEYAPGTVEAWKSHMLERNRLVAGLADAILITEATARSGTLNTAGHALEQGKTVFVVPGNITSPTSAGCNALIKQGATPVTCPEDILEVIAPHLLRPQTQLALASSPAEQAIVCSLMSGIRDGDALQETTELSAEEFNVALTTLELSGTIKALGGNQWTLR